jgi:Short-chain dehydrogenases of various substrate specificities
MAGKFGAKSTTEDVLADVNLKGKRILVTGVSAGLGVETACALVAHGADVVGAARDIEKAKRAASEVRKAAAETSGSFDVVELDLASLNSVRTSRPVAGAGSTFTVCPPESKIPRTLLAYGTND